jgi:hypothetical protein
MREKKGVMGAKLTKVGRSYSESVKTKLSQKTTVDY